MLKVIIYISFFAFLFYGCGSKFSLQKKRYSKGFYFATNKTRPSTNSKIYAVKEPQIVADSYLINKTNCSQITEPSFFAKQEVITSKESSSPRLFSSVNKIKSKLTPRFNYGHLQFKSLENNKDAAKIRLSEKKDPLDFLYAASAIYYIVSTIIVLIFVFALLYTTLPLNQFIAVVAVCLLLGLLICGVSF